MSETRSIVDRWDKECRCQLKTHRVAFLHKAHQQKANQENKALLVQSTYARQQMSQQPSESEHNDKILKNT